MGESSTSTPISIPATLTVNEFADKLQLKVTDVMKVLIKNGVMATINDVIDYDTAAIVADELELKVAPETSAAVKPAKKTESGNEKPRPPVIAMMGHVDHGKTSLLDAIRQSEVAAGEAGGITQHLSAYQVTYNKRIITFLDTPGHEAFSLLREHGAHLTDVAIIVVAADDGVQPQTEEAITFVQRAGVHLVVAINKIDAPGANVDKIKQQLNDKGLTPEEWGGDTVMVEVSAKSGQNIDKLLELVLLVADIEDLRARYDGLSEGTVIEAHVAPGLGSVATLLVQDGELNVGDFVVAGGSYAKIRSLEDSRGQKISKATPSMPVLIAGWKSLPPLGSPFKEATDEKTARNLAQAGQLSQRTVQVKKIISQSEIESAIAEDKVKQLPLVLKADVNGSLDSLLQSLATVGNDEVRTKIVAQGLGDINETDVSLAETAGAKVIGFNVALPVRIKQLAERSGVKVGLYKVIYELLDDIKAELSQMLEPEVVEKTVGELTVKGVFRTTAHSLICGGVVNSGKITPGLLVRFKKVEDSPTREVGKVENVQKDQAEAKEVTQGSMCGLNITTKHKVKLKPEDELEFFSREERVRSL